MQRETSQRGFSFWEVVIVVGILVVIMVAGIPAWRHYAARYQLDRETDQIVSALRFAHQKTVSEQISYILRFDKSANQYTLLRLNPDPEDPGSYIEETMWTTQVDAPIDLVEIYELTDDQVQFTAAGGVAEAGRIELSNSESDAKIIDVRPSGFIRSYNKE